MEDTWNYCHLIAIWISYQSCLIKSIKCIKKDQSIKVMYDLVKTNYLEIAENFCILSISAAKNLELMSRGSSMLKLKKNGKIFRRTFRMEDDFIAMIQVESRKIGCTNKSAEVIRGKYVIWKWMKFKVCACWCNVELPLTLS